MADFRPRLAGDRSSSEVISFLLPEGTPEEARGLSVVLRVGVVLLLLEAVGVAGELMLLRLSASLPPNCLGQDKPKVGQLPWSEALDSSSWAEPELETTTPFPPPPVGVGNLFPSHHLFCFSLVMTEICLAPLQNGAGRGGVQKNLRIYYVVAGRKQR